MTVKFFRFLLGVIAFETPYIDKFTSSVNVDALKKIGSTRFRDENWESTKTLPRENEVTLQKFVPEPGY